MIRGLRVVSILAILTAAFPLAARAVETAPFTNDDGLIHVQVSIDRQTPVPMLVDLGAGVDIVSERLAHLVSFTHKYTTMRLTGQRLDLPMGDVVTIDLGDIGIPNRTVGVWHGLVTARGVDGLISAAAFRDRVTTVDFHNHQIVVEDAVSFPDRRRTATRVPLILQDDLDTALGLFARFDFGNGKTGLCEIDSGSKGIVLDKVFESSGVPSLTLIGAPQTQMDRPPVTYADLIYDCTIGNNFWQGRTFTLDILNRAMWVQQQL